jgi:hypothetical protein
MQAPAIKHLWECKHSYYCEESDKTLEFKSFAAFLSKEGDADKDYNLLFRWDWAEEDGDGDNQCAYNGDDYCRNGKLSLFFMGQRKGLYRSVVVEVCRADEASVIKYLTPRWQHMQELWAPLAA